MKCIFNDFLRHNDTICLPLYKRIYPKWFDDSWTSGKNGHEIEKEIHEKELKRIATAEDVEEEARENSADEEVSME
jgi:hypothetical protein